MWVIPYRSGPRVRLDQGEAPELAGGEPRTMVILRSSLLVCCQQISDFGLEVRAYSGDGFGSHVDSHAVYEDGLAFDTVNWVFIPSGFGLNFCMSPRKQAVVSSLDLSISAYGRLILRVVVDRTPRKDRWLDGGPLTAANSIKPHTRPKNSN
jgi:hypothetical protein